MADDPVGADPGAGSGEQGEPGRRPDLEDHDQHTRADRPRPTDHGSAVVDFVLVGALTTVLFAGVLQLTLALHVRSTLIDCAAEGARYGALADRTDAQGVTRAVELIEMSLAPRFARDVRAQTLQVDGRDVVQIQVRAPLPVLGLLGPSGTLSVEGHALSERP